MEATKRLSRIFLGCIISICVLGIFNYLMVKAGNTKYVNVVDSLATIPLIGAISTGLGLLIIYVVRGILDK